VWHQVRTPADPTVVAAVVDLARTAEPACGPTLVVAIDGPSGSGKTTLALGVRDALTTALGRTTPVPVVHMDEIFPGWDGLEPAPGLLTTQVLEPLSRGADAAYRLWDWSLDRWGETRELPWTATVLVEGCGSTVTPAGRFAAVRVFVEADPAVRMARGIERDGETYRQHWERWAAQERAIYAADGTRDRAHLVVDTTDVH